MRNILITVMMLIVVAALFTSIISSDSTGVGAKIKDKGTTAAANIAALTD